MTYRVNSRAAITRQVNASSRVTVGIPVELLEINPGAAGGVQVSAEVIPIELLLKPAKGVLPDAV